MISNKPYVWLEEYIPNQIKIAVTPKYQNFVLNGTQIVNGRLILKYYVSGTQTPNDVCEQFFDLTASGYDKVTVKLMDTSNNVLGLATIKPIDAFFS